jgi:hypothetical protein
MWVLNALLATAITTAVTAAGAATAAAETRIDVGQRQSLTVTVYADGFALVHDVRRADLPAGAGRLVLADVARHMIVDSTILDAGTGATVGALGLDVNLLTPDALLQRSVGHAVGVVRTHPTTGDETLEPATLLAADGGIVLRYRDRIETGVPGRLVFPDVPAGLRARPTLVADIDSTHPGAADLALTYLTEGLDWRADYVALVDDDAETISLSGRAMLRNDSGLDLAGATVGLIAGSVHRVSQPSPVPYARATMAAQADAAPPPMPEAAPMADLYLYRLPAAVDLPDNTSTQRALLRLADRPMRRTYVSEAQVFARAVPAHDPEPTHPSVEIRFDNAAPDRDAPLPAGVVRIYVRDADGTLRLLGEDRMAATPAGREVRLSPAEAFDITVTRRQTSYRRSGLAEKVFETGWEITLTNAKPVGVKVTVVERLAGDWSILEASEPFQRRSAGSAEWTVDVPAKGKSVLTYQASVQMP